LAWLPLGSGFGGLNHQIAIYDSPERFPQLINIALLLDVRSRCHRPSAELRHSREITLLYSPKVTQHHL
jgi:hypothetical protein